LDPVSAVGSFFRQDPARILAVAAHLRGPDRYLESTVEGMSMGRTIPPGSRIRVDLADREDHALGEVVAFLAGQKIVVHRIVHHGQWGGARGRLLTRGDAALVPDLPLTPARVLGPVGGIQRGGTWMPLERPPRRSFTARVIASLALAMVIGALQASPRLAEWLVRLLHRGRPLRAACVGVTERLTPS
jgi:hypothetical protein